MNTGGRVANHQGPSVSDKKKKGCMFYGCLSTVVLCLVGAAILYWFIGGLQSSLAPVALPNISYSQEEANGVRAKIGLFAAAAKSGPAEINLSERDLNLALQSLPELVKIKDYVRITVNGDKIGAILSIPVKEIPFDQGQLPENIPLFGKPDDMHVNGRAVVRIDGSGAEPKIYLDNLELPGAPAPFAKVISTIVGRVDLFQKWKEKNPNEAKKLRGLEVRDSSLILKTN